MSIVPDLPNAKFKRVLNRKTFTVPNVIGTVLNILELPPKKFLLLTHFQFTHSQLLQTVPVNSVVIDDEPLFPVLATVSSVSRFYFEVAGMRFVATTPPSSVTQLIPVRRKISMVVDSTAVGAGTVEVDVYGYILDDEFDKFREYSSLTQ